MSEFTVVDDTAAVVSALSISDRESQVASAATKAAPAATEDENENEEEGDDEEDGEGEDAGGADGTAAGGKKRRKKKNNKKKKKGGAATAAATSAATAASAGASGVDNSRIIQALSVEPCAPLSRLIGGNTKYYCALGQTEIPSIPVHTHVLLIPTTSAYKSQLDLTIPPHIYIYEYAYIWHI
jgi:hypothetical protein